MRVFFSYSHKDEAVRDQLEVHCSVLKRNGEIETWHDRRILGGDLFDEKIRFELEHADLIILLISQHFLNSDYCYSVEMNRALQRAVAGEAHVLPIIAEVCDWQNSPVGKHKALPNDGKPLTKLANINDGFIEVVAEIRKIARTKSGGASPRIRRQETTSTVSPPANRSSNLRIRKQFTSADRDRYLFEAFEFLSKFFEASLSELEARNDGIETRFREISANAFTCQIYRNGATACQCQISLGTLLSRSHQITYSTELRDNSYNESLSVDENSQTLYLKPMMRSAIGNSGDDQLTPEGAAEYLWSMLIGRIQ